VFECKTKECARLWTFQHKSKSLLAPLMFAGLHNQCPLLTNMVTELSLITFISSIILVKQAVFPVPGAPDMYRLPGFPFGK